jgi:hypothetical protein
VQLTTLAFAIALGLSLIQVAEGVATFITDVTQHGHDLNEGLGLYGGGLNWFEGHHPFGQFVTGLIELGTVLLIALLVRRLSSHADIPAD